jgi:periplasmic copper chaperone A
VNTIIRNSPALLLAVAAAAQAHVTLEQPQAPAGSAYKAVLRITHGCEGSPTQTVTVQVPAGLRGAKPMPKAGWTVALRKAPLATPYDSHGRRVTEDVVEVRWTARTSEDWLADAHFDEFVLRGQLAQAAGTLWFKVRQDCERGSLDWSEVPAQGADTRGLKSPAVPLRILPAAAAGHVH